MAKPDRIIRRYDVLLAGGTHAHIHVIGPEGSKPAPAMLFLHPSPVSGASMGMVMQKFKDDFTCIAIDMPGYGLSPDTVDDPNGLNAYAHNLAAVMDAINLPSAAIFGMATGGTLGGTFAQMYPERVDFLILDAVADFDDAACAEIVDSFGGYFQDVTPRRDGAHLTAWWDMSRNLFVFFPFHSHLQAHRMELDLPPAFIVHHHMLDSLNAETGYSKAYKEAIYTERWEHIHQIPATVIINQWKGSLVRDLTDQLIEKGLGDNFSVLDLPWYADDPMRDIVRLDTTLVDAIKRASDMQNYQFIAPPPNTSAGRFMVQTPAGSVNVRGNTSGKGKPVLILHDWDEDSTLFKAHIEGFAAAGRPVIVPDLPGHGETAPLMGFWNIKCEGHATTAMAVMESLGFSEFDVIGKGMGAAAALTLKQRFPDRVDNIICIEPWYTDDDDEKDDWKALMAPDIAPTIDGCHIMRVWDYVRRKPLYQPWYKNRRKDFNRFDAPLSLNDVDTHAKALLRIGALAAPSFQACLDFNFNEKLEDIGDTPITIAAINTSGAGARVKMIAGIGENCSTISLPADGAMWAQVVEGIEGCAKPEA